MLPTMSTRPNAAEITKALVQLVWTTAVVAAPPVVLAHLFGNPLPAQMPDWGNVVSTPTQLIEPVVVINVIVCALWLAWATVFGYVILDAVDIARGAGRRVARMGPLGVPAAKLVAAVVVLVALARPQATASAVPYRAPARVTQVAAAPAPPATTVRTAVAVPATAAMPVAARVLPKYRVQDGDNEWDIAGATLGDPFRWPEILKLNHHLIANKDLLEPGWILTLPADAVITGPAAVNPQPVAAPATAPAAATPAAPTDGSATRTDAPTTQPKVLAGTPAATTATPPLVSEAPAPTQAPVSTEAPAVATTAPNPAPAVPAVPVTAERGPSTPTTWGTASPGTALPLAAQARGITTRGDYEAWLAEQPARPVPPVLVGAEDDRSSVPIGLAAPVAGMAAAAVGAALRRRRHRVLTRRPMGSALPMRDPSLASTETALARAVSPDAEIQIRWVDAALRMLGHRSPGRAGQPALIRPVPTGGVEVLWTRDPGRATPGFADTANPHTWLVDDDDLTGFEHAASTMACVAPATVSIGTLPEGPILANLTALSPLSIAGHPPAITEWLNSVGLELDAYPWSADVSFAAAVAAGPVVLRVVADVDRHTMAVIVEEGGPIDGWYLGFGAETVRLCSPTRELDLTMGAVGVNPADAARLRALLDEASVDPYTKPLTVIPAPEPAGDAGRPQEPVLRHACDVAAAAGIEMPPPPVIAGDLPAPDVSDTPDELVEREPAVDGDEGVAAEPSAAASVPTVVERFGGPVLSEPESWSPAIALHLLGPVAVTGTADRVRPKTLELLTLAVVSRPASLRRVEALEKLWEHDTGAHTLVNAVIRLRSELGDKSLVTNQDGMLSVSDAVECDWELFQNRVRAAKAAALTAQLGLMRDALALVTGPPLSQLPPGQFGWLDATGLRSQMEIAIGDTSEQVALGAMAAGDSHLAIWAVRQGLLGCPYHVGLYAHGLAAHAATSDLVAFEATMREAKARADYLDDDLPASVIVAYENLGRSLASR